MSDEQRQDYGAEQIKVLEGLEAVRKRPAMYIGSTSSQGLHHLVYEIVDNSIDEALAGHCDLVQVSINIDGSVTVVDNGRGIPTDMHQTTLTVGLAFFQQQLQLGGKFTVLMAGAFLSILPLLIIFFIAQKQFIEGIALSGVKR